MCIFNIGFITQFGVSCFYGFWMFHIFHLFLGLALPFQNKRLVDSKLCRRKVHFIEGTIVISGGLLSPVLTISISKYQDNGWHCFPQSTNVLFYAGIVPCALVFVIGLMLLFGSFWILQKVSNLVSINYHVIYTLVHYIHLTLVW